MSLQVLVILGETVIELFDSLSGLARFAYVYAVFKAFCSLLEAISDVISGKFVGPIVLDKCVKFRDPCLNRSRDIPPEAALFSTVYSLQLPTESIQ